LAVVNAFVAAINMLPVRVLDCGRCIYCLLCDRNDEAESEKKLDTMSKVVALISLVLCIAVFLISGFNFSLAAVTIYLNIITFFKKWS
jgi:membrane-associated protease RseP (regulator of RpoE activity)